jgi:hypothetical protein
MRKKVILKPKQKETIDRKLKEAKQKRLIKKTAFDNEMSAQNKLRVIRTILNIK